MNTPNTFKRRTLTLLLLCLAQPAAYARAQQPPDCERQVRAMLEDLSQAYQQRDAQKILSHYSDYFNASQPPYNWDALRDQIQRLLRSSSEINVSYQASDIRCVGDLAVATVAVRLQRRLRNKRETDTKEEYLHFYFQRQEDRWIIDSFFALEPNATDPEPGSEYLMPQYGFAATLPHGFRYQLTDASRDAGMVVGLSEDLRISLTLGAQRLPVFLEPKDLADYIENQVHVFFPQCAVTNKEIRRLKEHPAVILDTECPQYQHDSWARTIVLMDQKTLLIVAAATRETESRDRGADAANKLLASIRRIPRPPPAEEPPELADSTYRDKEFGFEISLPKGWKATIGERGTRVFVENPTRRGTIMIFAEERLEDADVMALTAKHVETMRKLLPSFSCRGPTALKVGPLRGAQCLSEFEFDKKVKRWSAYFTHKRRLYRIICDAQPAEDYEELQEAFRATVHSLRLKSQPPQPDEPQRTQHRDHKTPSPKKPKE